jgi:hypothetical protein
MMPRRCPQQCVLDRRGEGPEREDLRVLPVRRRVHWQRLHQQRQPLRALWLLIPRLPDRLSGQQELHPGAHQLDVRPGARPCQRCRTVLVLLSLQCLEERLCCWVLTQTDCCPLRCPQYKGSPSNYLQQQDSTFYSSAAGKNKWVAAACRDSGGISARVLQVPSLHDPGLLQPQQLSPLVPAQVRLDSQRLHRRAALHVRGAV